MCTDQLELLKSEIEKNITGFKSSRNFYRRKSFYAFISTSFLAGISTILLGLNIENTETATRRITLVITALITFINAYNAFFNHKDLWLANNKALIMLYELRFDIDYFENGSKPYDCTKVDLFKERYQLIMNEMNKTWFKARETSGK